MLRQHCRRIAAALKRKLTPSRKLAMEVDLPSPAISEAEGNLEQTTQLPDVTALHPCPPDHFMDPDPQDDPFATMSDDLFLALQSPPPLKRFSFGFGDTKIIRSFTFDAPASCPTYPFPIFSTRSIQAYKAIPCLRLYGKHSTRRKRNAPSTPVHRKAARVSAKPRSPSAASKPKRGKAPTIHPPLDWSRSRSKPLTFFDLPGEIRNQIYGHFTHRDSQPVEALFRHVLTPEKTKPGKVKYRKLVRRFPIEPSLAMVSHQMREEVLSMFYSENRFTVTHTFGRTNYGLDMTTASMISRWEPSIPVAAAALNHLDISFVAQAPWSLAHVCYSITKTVEGEIQISQKPLMHLFCNCLEERMARETIPVMMAARGNNRPPPSICQVAAFLAARRQRNLQTVERPRCDVCQARRLLKEPDDDDAAEIN